MATFRALILKAAVLTQIAAASDTLSVGAGVTTDSGNLTLSAAGTDVQLASGKNFSLAGGGSTFDLSGSAGLQKTTTGAQTIGPGTVTVSGATTFTAAGTALTVNNNQTITGTSTHTGVINANGNIQRSTSGTMSIGTDANTTAITVGSGGAGGVVFTVAGDLAVTGNETITGSQTYTGAAQFNGNVTFGDAATDTITFTGRIAGGSLPFIKQVDAVISVDTSTTNNTVGGKLTLNSGTGGVASGGTGGAGGLLAFQPGAGGAGVGGQTAGAGGAVTITGGTGGAAGGGTQGAGGAITIDGGTGLTNGAIQIGNTNAASVGIGRSGITTTITGGLTQLTGAVSLTGNGASSFTTSSGALTLTSAAAATWSTAAGALTISGFAGINMQNNGTTNMVYGAGTIIVQAGSTLSTTSTGQINLPQNASARFQVEGVATTAGVTAANLNTLTDTSNADALHTHAGLPTVTGLTTTGVTTGLCGYISAANTMTLTDNLALVSSRFFGVNTGTVGSMVTSGIIAALKCTTAGGSPASTGTPLFLAASTDEASAAGKVTATVPATTGVYVAQVALTLDNANYAGSKTVKALIQVMPIVLL